MRVVAERAAHEKLLPGKTRPVREAASRGVSFSPAKAGRVGLAMEVDADLCVAMVDGTDIKLRQYWHRQ